MCKTGGKSGNKKLPNLGNLRLRLAAVPIVNHAVNRAIASEQFVHVAFSNVISTLQCSLNTHQDIVPLYASGWFFLIKTNMQNRREKRKQATPKHWEYPLKTRGSTDS